MQTLESETAGLGSTLGVQHAWGLRWSLLLQVRADLPKGGKGPGGAGTDSRAGRGPGGKVAWKRLSVTMAPPFYPEILPSESDG